MQAEALNNVNLLFILAKNLETYELPMVQNPEVFSPLQRLRKLDMNSSLAVKGENFDLHSPNGFRLESLVALIYGLKL